MSATATQAPPGAPGVTVHSGLTGLGAPADDHLQYLLLAGRAGGQTAIGGTASNQELALRGTSNANLGAIRCQSPILFDDTLLSNATQYFIDATPTQVTTAAFVGGGLSLSPSITFGHSTAIWEGFRVGAILESSVNLGFSAMTLMQALPRSRSAVAGRNPIAITILNGGPLHEYTGGSGSVNAVTIGVNWSPQIRASTSGGTINWTEATCLKVAPKWATQAGTVINMGTVRGMRGSPPGPALFSPSAGTEIVEGYVLLDMDAFVFPTTNDAVVIRSAMTDAADRFLIQNNGGARSDFGGGDLLDVGVVELLGDTTAEAILLGAGGDARIYFDGTDLVVDAQVVPSSALLRVPHSVYVSSSSGTFRTGGGRLKKITRIDSAASPYTLLASDHVLFVDTDGGAVTVNLPAGVLDTEHRVVNVGTSANNVTLTPSGAELLYGVAGTFAITDGLEARLGYETTEGWF